MRLFPRDVMLIVHVVPPIIWYYFLKQYPQSDTLLLAIPVRDNGRTRKQLI